VADSPVTVFLAIATLVGLLYSLKRVGFVARIYGIVPVVVWIYLTPMILSTFGLLPSESAAYEVMGTLLMPFGLFLLSVTIDVPALLRMGKPAGVMVLTGTVGVFLGALISFSLWHTFMHEQAWHGFAVMSGAWIGGSANAIAMQQSLNANPDVLAPILVVDTVVGYGWFTVLVALSAYQDKFSRWLGAGDYRFESSQVGEEHAEERRPLEISSLAVIVGLGFAATMFAGGLANVLPELGDPPIVTKTMWAMLIVVTLGLVLSFTPLRRVQRDGANDVAYLAIFLLLATLGARGDLSAFFQAPVYLAAGLTWIVVHIGLLLLVARVMRYPFFFVATGSMANLGGVVTTPIIAGIYRQQLAALGVLMALGAQILGVYIPVVVARILSWIAA
jgi:uncharacterized membrane protein